MYLLTSHHVVRVTVNIIHQDDDSDDDDEINRLQSQQEAAQFGWFDDLHVYDTQTKTWSQPVQLSMGKPSPRCAASMIAHKNILGMPHVYKKGFRPHT